MKRLLLIIYFGCSSLLYGQTPADDPNWSPFPVFSDDFNTINTTTIWNVYDCNWPFLPNVPYITFSNRPINVKASSSILTLSLQNDGPLSTCTVDPDPITGAEMETQSADFKYGYFECTAILPWGTGYCPAFWLWSAGPNEYREIDIFEAYPGRIDKNGWTTVLHDNTIICTGTLIGQNYNDAVLHGLDGRSNIVSDYTQWHKYGLEWTPTKIIWYFDDKIIRNSYNPGIINPMKLVFDIAGFQGDVFGVLYNQWGPFPAYMYVDNVNIYKYNCSDGPLSQCQVDFNTLTYGVKKYIKIGGTGCVNSIPPEKNVTLRAEEFIEISGDFTVPLGSGLYLDVNPCK